MAFTSLIGMLTRPKEIAPFQMDLTFDTLQVAFTRFPAYPFSYEYVGLSSYDANH